MKKPADNVANIGTPLPASGETSVPTPVATPFSDNLPSSAPPPDGAAISKIVSTAAEIEPEDGIDDGGWLCI
jgi:hypothetical protein